MYFRVPMEPLLVVVQQAPTPHSGVSLKDFDLCLYQKVHSEMPRYSRGLLRGLLPIMSALFLIPFDLFAWTNGELLI
jgi:hypothetical protein